MVSESADPDILPDIYRARCLSNRPWDQRFTPYASIGELIAAHVRTAPDKPFLTYYGASGKSADYTYAGFQDATRRVSGFMARRLGIGPGDRVATLMVNDPRTVLIYFAAWLLGATVAPVNVAEDDERVAYIIRNSEATAVFAAEDQVRRLKGLRAALDDVTSYVQVGGTASEPFCSFEEGLSEDQLLPKLPDLTPDAECLIVYTSGTTGAPKGVVLEQANLLADALSIAEWHRFTPDDRAMCVLPIHHVNGTVVTLMTPLYSGGSVVLNRRFSAHAFWKTLAAERCTWVSVVPTILAFLAEARTEKPIETGSASPVPPALRHIICGAGPLTVDLARKFYDMFGVRVVHGYGLSETTCYSCFLPVDQDEADYKSWMFEQGFPSIGCPIAANEMQIHDEHGAALPEGARGEIVARGHNVMKYYFKRPDANRDTFLHGWFRSGDEGFYRIGPDGRPYFFITGRLKELIIRGGVNYSPFEIDEVLAAIPGVKAAMAVGFDNDMYGEEIGAYVQLEPGAQLTAQEILQHCRRQLPSAKSPKVVVFGESFPVTSTGKYQRNKLKPLFARWQATQFRQR